MTEYRVTHMVMEKAMIDIKFTLQFQYKPQVLKRNFKIAVNINCFATIRATLYFSSKRYLNLEWIAGPGDPPTTFLRRAGGQQLLLLFRGDGPRRGRPHALLLGLGAQLNLARRGCVNSYSLQCCQWCCKPKIYHHTIHIYILLSTVRLIALVGLPRLKQLFGGGPSFIPEFTALTISYQNVTSSVEQRLVKIQWCTNIFTEEVPRLHTVVAIITHEISFSVQCKIHTVE